VTKSVWWTVWLVLVLVPLSGAVGTEAQSGPAIKAEWLTTGGQGGALNVSISNLPPNAKVEVTVTDVSHNSQTEQPVGTPPAQANEKGEWPGPKAGSKAGYPGTATDPGGTRYVISVKVNGKTGPSQEVLKPEEPRSFWSILATLGTVLITDAAGITGKLEERAACPARPAPA
jgi:hypothetical protein